MFEGVTMTQRMRTSKHDPAQANKLMIRQKMGYVTSRVRAASTVKAEAIQPKANTMRYVGSVGRDNTGQPYEDVITLSRAMITQTVLDWRCWVRRTVRGTFKVMYDKEKQGKRISVGWNDARRSSDAPAVGPGRQRATNQELRPGYFNPANGEVAYGVGV